METEKQTEAAPAEIADVMCLVRQIQEYIRKQGADGETWAEHAARSSGIPLQGIILYTLTLWTRRVCADQPGPR